MSSEVISLVNLVVNVFTILIIGRALLSWFDPGMQTPVGRVLRDVTEPIIAPIRQVMPSLGMFDLSPIVALLLIRLIGQLITQAIG
ncbi:MAG: YggT family protein [Thermomicrobiales bacterium]|nr:YggT family protein [Thermomicrobiales bacterium]